MTEDIQKMVDQLDTNLLKDTHGIKHDLSDPETWCVIRWLILKLDKDGVCVDNHNKIFQELKDSGVIKK